MGLLTAAVDHMSGLRFCGNGSVVCSFRHGVVVVGRTGMRINLIAG